MNYLKYDETKKEYVYDIPVEKLEYYRLNNFLTHTLGRVRVSPM